MRILKVGLIAILAVLAVAAGVFVVAALAIGGAVYLLVRWLRRRFGSHRAARSPNRRAGADVIEVTATEVPGDPADRLRG